MRQAPPLVVGNWKMNGRSEAALALARSVADGAPGGSSLVLCPPFTALDAVAAVLRGSGIGLGGQDCSPHAEGAHTGDIAAVMLVACGCTHVILGHSERRQGHGESDATVRAKVLAAVGAGLRPIVCVGETEAQRAAGGQTETVGRQLAVSLPRPFAGIVAYEPIWAIGTGRHCGADEIATMHHFIRADLVRQFGAEAGGAVPILYGGSVKPDNAGKIFAIPDLGGALVGGASLDAAALLAIARAGGG